MAQETRNPTDRIRNWTGTVHYSRSVRVGRCIVLSPACGPVATASSWLYPSVATVTCERCIALRGADEPGHVDVPLVNEHVARREAERAARRAARAAAPQAER